MFEKISIIGDGAMGSVLAMLLCEKGATVRMWGYNAEQLRNIESTRENKKFLPGYKLPAKLIFEPDDERIMTGTNLIVSAVPCQYMRNIWQRLKSYTPPDIPIVSITKGIENKTLLRPTEIIKDVLKQENIYAVLSGPTIADELAHKLTATACAACKNEKIVKEIQLTFSASWLRVYTNTDLPGVELAGAMKNVIAIAAGIIDGIKAGDNAKAALLCRGLTEITRLGVACGAKPQTFAGLTGLGDLVTTCFSPKGRNRSFGQRIGEGQNVQQAKNATKSVIEGLDTCESVIHLAEKHNIEMPITKAVYDILFKGKTVWTALEELMARKLKAE